MQDIIEHAPAGFGAAPADYRYDVLYLKDLDPGSALGMVPTREGVDASAAGPGVLYYSRLVARATASQLGRVAAMPIYQRITIRNWNTTLKLTEMASGGHADTT